MHRYPRVSGFFVFDAKRQQGLQATGRQQQIFEDVIDMSQCYGNAERRARISEYTEQGCNLEGRAYCPGSPWKLAFPPDLVGPGHRHRIPSRMRTALRLAAGASAPLSVRKLLQLESEPKAKDKAYVIERHRCPLGSPSSRGGDGFSRGGVMLLGVLADGTGGFAAANALDLRLGSPRLSAANWGLALLFKRSVGRPEGCSISL
jgi:hypothetical protein